MSEGNERRPETDLPASTGVRNGSAANGSDDPGREGAPDLAEVLKRQLPSNRLPAEARDEILAALPPVEERERLFRELMTNGGISSEEFLSSLGLDDEPRS